MSFLYEILGYTIILGFGIGMISIPLWFISTHEEKSKHHDPYERTFEEWHEGVSHE